MITESPDRIGAAQSWSSDGSCKSAFSAGHFSLVQSASYWSHQSVIIMNRYYCSTEFWCCKEVFTKYRKCMFHSRAALDMYRYL